MTKCAQRQHRQRATRRAVGIEIANDQDALPAFDAAASSATAASGPAIWSGRISAPELALRFLRITDAARAAVDPPQQWGTFAGQSPAVFGFGRCQGFGRSGAAWITSWPIGPAPQHSSIGLL